MIAVVTRIAERVAITLWAGDLRQSVTPPRGVLTTTKMGYLDREVTPPRGVSTSTGIVDFDRDFTPRGEICHLRSRRAAARCARNDRWQISDLRFAI